MLYLSRWPFLRKCEQIWSRNTFKNVFFLAYINGKLCELYCENYLKNSDEQGYTLAYISHV